MKNENVFRPFGLRGQSALVWVLLAFSLQVSRSIFILAVQFVFVYCNYVIMLLLYYFYCYQIIKTEPPSK